MNHAHMNAHMNVDRPVSRASGVFTKNNRSEVQNVLHFSRYDTHRSRGSTPQFSRVSVSECVRSV